ncbi:MAG: TonB-dependent receptor [Nannocystaceae bacterium]
MRTKKGDRQAEADRDNPGFVTAIEVRDLEGERPADALPQLLSESAGITVRSFGGLGNYSAVSLRGSTGQQVGFYLDGVPLGQSLSGLVSPSDLPLDGLDRVEVYRGYLPLAFGAGIGGAIHLVGDPGCEGPLARTSAGVGSFAAHEARAAIQRRIGRACLHVRAGVAGAAGGFVFRDTRGTLQDTSDDRWTRRRNNAYERTLAQIGVYARRGGWRLSARELVFWKRQGIPGPGNAQSSQTELATLTARTLLHARRPALFGERGGAIAWVAGLGVERRRYRDPLGEVGLGVDDERLLALDLYLSPRLSAPLWSGASLHLLGEGRGERILVDEAGGAATGVSGDATRDRLSGAFGAQLEQHLFDRRLFLAPALRVDVVGSRFAVPVGEGEIDDAGRDAVDTGLSPRVAARLSLRPGLSLRGSVGRYFRAPTILELFGDRGYVIGNEGLTPERGTNAEGGLVIAGAWSRRHRARAHAVGFWTRAEDLIQWLQTGPVLQPRNLSGATIRGLEVAVNSAFWRRTLTVDANYTLLATRGESPDASADGKRLPGRPLHQIFARVGVGRRFPAAGTYVEPRVHYSVESIAGTFLDAAERVPVPPRTLHAAGVSVDVGPRFHASLELRNLLDTRVTTWTPPIRGAQPLTVPISDFIGYPLPGRAIWAGLRVDLEPTHRTDR